MSVSEFPLTSAAILGSIAVYQGTLINCGRARGKAGLKSPIMTGNDEFEGAYRIQMNTLESLVTIIPTIWMASALSKNDKVGAAVGGAWVIGRIAYWIGYPDKRSAGVGIAAAATFGGFGYCCYQLLKRCVKQ
jgi:glutathione S-transferase